MLVLQLLMFLAGLVALYFGAEWLVSGASSIALRVGIPALVVGLTVVAFGTSSPELLVSLAAVYAESDAISVGNIIGSNIANIALILGCAAMIRPLEVAAVAVRREYPLMLLASALLALLAYRGADLSFWDGLVLLIFMIAYLTFSFVMARRAMDELAEANEIEELGEIDPDQSTTPRDLFKIGLGVTLLALGAYLMVESAVTIATVLEIDPLVIGISVVALGTSLPELAPSVVASYRSESDISVGNVIGSNIFNVGMVLGIVPLLHPLQVGADALRYDMWVMLGVTLLIWPIMRTGFRISRLEGGLLVLFYLVYMVTLFIR